MKRSDVILTDSGGVQEETTILGTPTLVMREVTERPEALEYGTSFLVGTDPDKIREMASKAILGSETGKKDPSIKKLPPFGSGNAANIIVNTIERIFFGVTGINQSN